MGIQTVVAGETTRVPLVTASGAYPPSAGIPYQGLWYPGDFASHTWRIEQNPTLPAAGWTYLNACQATCGADSGTPWNVNCIDDTQADITADILGPFSTPGTGRMQVVTYHPGPSTWVGACFDVVLPCSPVESIAGATHGDKVIIAWDNPNGTTTLYRVYYAADGMTETGRTLLLSDSAESGFIDTLNSIKFGGAGYPRLIINYLLINNCSSGTQSKVLPVFTDGGTPPLPLPFDAAKALSSLIPISALRHERIRR